MYGVNFDLFTLQHQLLDEAKLVSASTFSSSIIKYYSLVIVFIAVNIV